MLYSDGSGNGLDFKFSNCYANVNITQNATAVCCVGGFVGFKYEDYSTAITNCFATGNIASTSSLSGNRIGGLVGLIENAFSNRVAFPFENCFRYDGQTISVNAGAINTTGEECTLSDLNDSNFYTEILGWSADIWDFSDLDFANGKLPTLKSIVPIVI